VATRLALEVGDEKSTSWTQNSGMNITDKERLYAASRGHCGGGLLALQEPMPAPPTSCSR